MGDIQGPTVNLPGGTHDSSQISAASSVTSGHGSSWDRRSIWWIVQIVTIIKYVYLDMLK